MLLKRCVLFSFKEEISLSKRIEKRRDELLGKEFETNNSGKCFIIDYKGADNITVMFYDPVFITDGNKSFAQLTPDEKDAVSHRGRALRQLYSELSKVI